MSEDTHQDGMSRRDAMKFGAVLAVSAVINKASRFMPKELTSPERRIINGGVLRLDFFGLEIDTLAKKLFGEGFDRRKALDGLGIPDGEISISTLSKATPTDDEQARLLFLEALVLQYSQHGEDVNLVAKRTREKLNSNTGSRTDSVSIDSTITYSPISWDKLGNPSITIGIDPEKIKDLIRTNNQGVVSMSLQIGEFDMTYKMYRTTSRDVPLTSKTSVGDETSYFKDQNGEKIKISKEEYESIQTLSQIKRVDEIPEGERTIFYTDGYWGEKTYSNLSNIADIAREFPDRVFVVAGGNPFIHETKGVQIPDIRDAKRRLREEGLWPENLIVVGFIGQDNGLVHPGSFGADPYVSYDDMNLDGRQGSSFAVAVVPEVVSGIIDDGAKTPTSIISRLKEFTNEEIYSEPVNVLDLDRARKRLA